MTEQLKTITSMSTLEALVGAKITQELDGWVAKYPANKKRSAVMAGLMMVQKANKGKLTPELMDAVADYLGIPHVAAYEVATFYSMYNMKDVGQYVINVCTNISCMLRGSDEVIEHLKERLNISVGETTKDGLFTLRTVECLGACVGGPMFEVAEVYHEHLNPEKIDQILDRLAKPAS